MIPHPSGGAAVTDAISRVIQLARLACMRCAIDRVQAGHHDIWAKDRKGQEICGYDQSDIDAIEAVEDAQSRRADPVREELEQEESGAILPTASEASMNKEEAAPVQAHPVFKFLLGEGPLNNYWFGETPPAGPKSKRKRPYWWRSHLRSALACSSAPLHAGSMANNSSQGIRDAIIEECARKCEGDHDSEMKFYGKYFAGCIRALKSLSDDPRTGRPKESA